MDARRFAELLTGYCLDVQAGQQVLVRSSTLAGPLLLELQRAILRREAWPVLRPELPGAAAGFYAHARERQLDAPGSLAEREAKEVDALLGIQAPENTRALAGIDPARIAQAQRGRSTIRERTLRKRWCSTVWPTEALAQQAGMALAQYAELLRGALFLDRDDPVAAWGELSAGQARLVQRLDRARELHLQAPSTDLRLTVKGRRWQNSDGRRNMPSGEVFTSPHERSAEGTVHFAIPSSPSGVDVAGVTLRFAEGEVVEARAERGEPYLRHALASDDGARRLGEIGIGTNTGLTRPTGTILLDEKLAGTVHLALGRSYPETGGTNASALHWDLICDLRGGGTLSADGQAIVEDGKVVEG